MSIKSGKKSVLKSITYVTLFIGIIFVMAPQLASAESPADCNSSGLGIDLARTPSTIINGGTGNFAVHVDNGPIESGDCDVNGIPIIFTKPAADGTATGGTVTLCNPADGGAATPPNCNFPAGGTGVCYAPTAPIATALCPVGYTQFINAGLSFAINVNPGVTSAQSQAAGDCSNCLQDGTVPEDNSPVHVSKALGTTVRTPVTTLTKSANVTSGLSPLPVRYTYADVAAGTASFKNVVLTDDPVCAPQVGPVKTGGDQDDFLDPGETWTWTCDTTVTQTVTNTAYITADICASSTCATTIGTHTGNSQTQGNDPNERDSVTVTILTPDTLLTKSANVTSGPSPLPVRYTYTEENTGDTALENVVITDDFCSPAVGPGGSDVGGDSILSPGETWTFTCDTTVTQTTTNHAFATADICIDLDCTSDVGTHTGDPQVQGSDESERDEVTVTIVNPHTTLTKSANVTSGTSPLPVRYTYSEVNDGDTSFKNLVLTDDPVCAPQVGPVKTGGDQDSFLDPGETWTWTCDTTLTQTTTNTAFITAEICSDDTCTASLGTHSGNPSGGNAPTEHDSETVTIFATTRTIGYWQTHLTQFKAYWPDTAGDPGTINCDDFDVGTDAQALGGMYASIPKNTDKSQRSDLDQARMRLAQQLVGAILNNLAFGSVPGGSISIDDAKAAFCSDNIGDINAAQSAMGAFNSSGDAIPFPPGFVNSNATPQAAKAFANVAFWDFLDTKII